MSSSTTRIALSALANRRLLIVDDTPEIHAAIRQSLAPSRDDGLDAALAEVLGQQRAAAEPAMTFELTHAHQGAEAVDLFRAAAESDRPFAGVFLDMRMPPGIDGLETAVLLSRIDRQVGIVFSSAYADHGIDEIASRLGGREQFFFLRKPFAIEECQQLALALVIRWDERRRRSHLQREVYTVLADEAGRLGVRAVRPTRVTDRALVFDQPLRLPVGSERRVLRPDVDPVPDTPHEAIRQFIAAQERLLAAMEHEVQQERTRLAEAKRLLEQMPPCASP
jgi:CheY-like chemotaxis protein